MMIDRYYSTIGQLTFFRSLNIVVSLLVSLFQIYLFGASREVEIFLVSTNLFQTIINLTQSGQLGELLLPIYHRVKTERGSLESSKVFSILVNNSLVFAVVLCLFFFISSYFVMDFYVPGFTEAEKKLAVKMFQISLIAIPVSLLNSYLGMFLNAERVYGKIEFFGVLNSSLSIVSLVLGYKFLGIWSLLLSFLTGKILELGLLVKAISKTQLRYSFIFKADSFSLKDLVKISFPTSLYVLTTQIYGFVVTAMLSLLPPGVLAVYRYVQIIYTKATGLFVAPVLTVFFSEFSLIYQKGGSFVEFAGKTIKHNFYIVSCILLIVIAAGFDAVNFLWANDKFTTEQLQLSYNLLVFFFTGLIITSIGSIFRKITLAVGLGKIVYFFWCLSQLMTSLFVYLIIDFYEVAGLRFIVIVNLILLNAVPVTVFYIKNRQFFRSISLKANLRTLVLMLTLTPVCLVIRYSFDVSYHSKVIILVFLLVKVVGILALIYVLSALLRIESFDHLQRNILAKLKGIRKRLF